MASLLRGWHLTTEGQWLLRNLFSQRALQNGCMDDSLKKLFQWKSDITSTKVYAQLVPVLGLEKNKNRPINICKLYLGIFIWAKNGTDILKSASEEGRKSMLH